MKNNILQDVHLDMPFSLWKDFQSDFLEITGVYELSVQCACICNPSPYAPIIFLRLFFSPMNFTALKKKHQINHLWHFKETTEKLVDLKNILNIKCKDFLFLLFIGFW